jgi:hypothetical protein
LARRAFPASGALERALATAVGLPMIVVPSSTLLGALGWLNARASVAAIGLEAAGLCLLAFWRRPGARANGDEPAAASGRTTRLETAALGAALAGLGCLAYPIGRTQLLLGFRPQWDDLSYHGPMAAHWLQAGRLVLAPYSYHAYYAGNAELFVAWLMLPTWLDAYASLAGLYWLVLAVLALAQLGRRLEAGAAASALAGLLLLACWPFAEQARSLAATDLAGAALITAATALAIAPAERDGTSGVRWRVFYVGCVAGLATGTKITYALHGVLLLLWLLGSRRPRPLEAVRWALLYLLCASCCGGYWYARNFVLASNPLFPAGILSFAGPLDAVTRAHTSLAFQLELLSGAKLTNALRQLANWPALMTYVFGAAYGMTFMALAWPRFYRQPAARRAAFLLLAGILALVVAATGPFSGTVNGRTAQLQVRLRFLLLVPLFGLPLVSYWVGRSGPLRAWLVFAGTGLGLFCTGIGWALGLGAPAAGAVLALSLRHAWESRGSRVRGLLGTRHVRERVSLVAVLASCVTLPLLAQLAMGQKELNNVQAMRSVTPGWGVADRIPRGARLTWFSTFESYKYYRAFGPQLVHVPIEVRPDGSPFVFMHEGWPGSSAPWWLTGKRARRVPEKAPAPVVQPPVQRAPPHSDDLVANLRAQGIEYVVVMRKGQGPWPSQHAILRASKQVIPVAVYRTSALFKLRAVAQ